MLITYPLMDIFCYFWGIYVIEYGSNSLLNGSQWIQFTSQWIIIEYGSKRHSHNDISIFKNDLK